MKIADAIRTVACPRCYRLPGERCTSPTGRNHTERVRAAIVAELRDEARLRGIDPKDIGL